jgi:hypothetical protein
MGNQVCVDLPFGGAPGCTFGADLTAPAIVTVTDRTRIASSSRRPRDAGLRLQRNRQSVGFVANPVNAKIVRLDSATPRVYPRLGLCAPRRTAADVRSDQDVTIRRHTYTIHVRGEGPGWKHHYNYDHSTCSFSCPDVAGRVSLPGLSSWCDDEHLYGPTQATTSLASVFG